MFAEGYIGIAGTIGVGKSTLTMDLAHALNFEPILDEVDGNESLHGRPPAERQHAVPALRRTRRTFV